MFGFSTKPKQPTKYNIKKLTATVKLLDGSNYVVITKGLVYGDFFLKADVDLFYSRHAQSGGIHVSNTKWIPRERIKEIDFELEDYYTEI